MRRGSKRDPEPDVDMLTQMEGGWREAHESVRREVLDPESETGGEKSVLWQENNGDWDRIMADAERLLAPLQRIWEPTRLIRAGEREMRLLRALSIVTGWSIDTIWNALLCELRSEFERAQQHDAETLRKGGLPRRTVAVLRDGICGQTIWLTSLNSWWVGSMRSGRWQASTVPEVALTWDVLPEEAMMGPALVQWLTNEPGAVPRVSALVNGVLHDKDSLALSGSMFFFITLHP